MLTCYVRFLDALYYSIDGNFHANLKDKRFDKDDVPLTKGAGYFADEDVFSAYVAKLGPLEPEVCFGPRCGSLFADRCAHSRVHATSSWRWAWVRTGDAYRGRLGSFALGICSFCQVDTSICKREKGMALVIWCFDLH